MRQNVLIWKRETTEQTFSPVEQHRLDLVAAISHWRQRRQRNEEKSHKLWKAQDLYCWTKLKEEAVWFSFRFPPMLSAWKQDLGLTPSWHRYSAKEARRTGTYSAALCWFWNFPPWNLCRGGACLQPHLLLWGLGNWLAGHESGTKDSQPQSETERTCHVCYISLEEPACFLFIVCTDFFNVISTFFHTVKKIRKKEYKGKKTS